MWRKNNKSFGHLRAVNRFSCSAFSLVIAFLFSVAWWACGNKDKAPQTTAVPATSEQLIEIEDARGKTVSLERSAIKVVSLIPSLTEYIYQIDKGNLLVGRSEWCLFPEDAQKVKVAGGVNEMDEEAILTMKPDVVLVSRMMNLDAIDYLESKGLKVVILDQQNWKSIRNDLEILGKIIDSSGDVKTLMGWMEGHRKSINDQIMDLKDLRRIKTAVLYDRDKLNTAGPHTFVDEMIDLAGGANIAAGEKSQWPSLSFETLLHRNPEVIIFAASEENPTPISELARILITSGTWSQLEAIKNNRVFLIESDLLTIPGPRQTLALRQIARAIHPNLFEKAPGLLQLDLGALANQGN